LDGCLGKFIEEINVSDNKSSGHKLISKKLNELPEIPISIANEVVSFLEYKMHLLSKLKSEN